MFKKIFAAAALSLIASSSFAAAPTGIYAGFDLGETKVDGLDGHKAAVGGFVGYGFNQYFATELGYRHLGTWGVYGIDVKVKQTHLSLVGSYPLTSQLDVYGRLGYNQLRGQASYAGTTFSADSSDALYGVGLHYNFTANVSGRFEIQKPSSDSVNYGVGLVWKF